MTDKKPPFDKDSKESKAANSDQPKKHPTFGSFDDTYVPTCRGNTGGSQGTGRIVIYGCYKYTDVYF